MKIFKKVYALYLAGMLSMLGAFIFIAMPRIGKVFTEGLAAFQGTPAADAALDNLHREFVFLNIFLVVLTICLLAVTAYYSWILIKPLNMFLKNLAGRFFPGKGGNFDDAYSAVESVRMGAAVAHYAPIGIMLVDRDGIIRFFNREASDITEFDPQSVTGRPMLNFFPNNYYNYTMEVIKTGREYMGLRNIIKVGDFFKEIIFSISPLTLPDTVSGAVAVFQDVTPQRKLIEVQAAYSLVRDMVTQRDLDGMAGVIAKSAAEMVDIEFSAVFLADREGGLVIRSACGIAEEAVKNYNARPARVDSPEMVELYRHRLPLLHGDIGGNAVLEPLMAVPGACSFYSFPIICEDRLVGLLNLYSRQKNKLNRDMICLLQSLSGQVSSAVGNFLEMQRMRTMASVDGLTGLFNKKYFLENLSARLDSVGASGPPLSLAMMDLDHFKSINDRYGHQAGDRLLKDVAGVMLQQADEGHCVCRFGGEEFSIIMPGVTKDGAVEAVNRIRFRIENSIFHVPGCDGVEMTISGGVACFPDDAKNAGDLILFSDISLYAAKRSGRNRVVAYSPGLKLI